jgi:hypothetical protein
MSVSTNLTCHSNPQASIRHTRGLADFEVHQPHTTFLATSILINLNLLRKPRHGDLTMSTALFLTLWHPFK